MTIMLQSQLRRYLLLVGLALVCLPATAPGHEFWIQPSSFKPKVGETIALNLEVGEAFQGENVARNAKLIRRFVVLAPQGEIKVPGNPGDMPAGRIQLKAPGLYVAGYRSRRSHSILSADKFTVYLQQDGLEHVIEEREKVGEIEKIGFEVFSRCAKSLLAVGKNPQSGYDRRLGFTLELVPQANPYTLKPGEQLPVTLLYLGQPLKGALIAAVSRENPGKRHTARSDNHGRVVFQIDQSGPWLISAVHMVRAPKEAKADWESFWASLTFAIKRPAH